MEVNQSSGEFLLAVGFGLSLGVPLCVHVGLVDAPPRCAQADAGNAHSTMMAQEERVVLEVRGWNSAAIGRSPRATKCRRWVSCG